MIAVTGAAGFIGSNLARHLSGLGRHRLLLVDLPLDHTREINFAGLSSFQFVEHLDFLDMLQRDECELEAIFHLGACSDTTESDWGFLRRNNVEYSQHLWQWCARREVPFIYASSAATYGDGSRGFDDQTPPEDLLPLNLYGKSKNEFDYWALEGSRAGEPTPKGWAGLKFFNVYGPQEGHKGRMASMVWHAYHQIVSRGEVALFKSTDPAIPDGGQSRDFVFVEDCIAQMIWLWRHPEASGIYNCGTGQARTFRDLVDATFAAMGRTPGICFIETPPDLHGRYQNFTQATTAKLRAQGYHGQPTSLEQGVRQYVGWLKASGGPP